MPVGVYESGRLVVPRSITPAYPKKVRHGCVLYLDMQDMGGKLVDHSCLHNHGTNYGSASVAGSAGLVRKFDGVDDYIRLAHSNSINAINAFTLEAWTKADIVPRGSGVIAHEYGSIVRYEIGYGFNEPADGSAKAKVGFYTGSTWYLASDTVDVAVGVWVHLSGTWDGTSLRVYKNAVLAGSNAPGATPSTSTDAVFVGRRHDSAGSKPYFPGSIGTARIYNRALSVAEIAEIYAEEAWRY